MKSSTRFTIEDKTTDALQAEQRKADASGVAPGRQTENEAALNDVARREQILAVQLKAHRHCMAQLHDERARFEAERSARTERTTEEASAGLRQELELARQEFEAKRVSESTELKRREEALAQREAELDRFRVQLEFRHATALQAPRTATSPSQSGERDVDPHQLLSGLAQKAADLAGIIEAVTHTHRHLDEARTGHEAAAKRHSEEIHQRESALTARETGAGERIRAAESQLDLERQRVARTQQAIASRESALDQLKRDLSAVEEKSAARQQAQDENAARMAEQHAHLDAKRNAIEAAGQQHQLRQNELTRLEQEAAARSASLLRRQSEISAAEQDILAARQEAVDMLAAAARAHEDLEAAEEKLRTDRETASLEKEAQAVASHALEQRIASLAEQSAFIEEKRGQISKEADEVHQHATALANERTAMEAQRSKLAAEETAFLERMLAFDERQRRFQDSIKSLLAE